MSMKNALWQRLACAFLCACLMSLFPAPAEAEKTDWSDSGYPFSSVKRILVENVAFGESEELSSAIMRKTLQDEYMKHVKKAGGEAITEEQARDRLSALLGVDLDAVEKQDPARAKSLWSENLNLVADMRIQTKIKDWSSSSYIVPERTVWEEKERKRTVWRDGKKVEESYYTTVPVTYPAHRVHVSRIFVTLEAYDAKTGKLVFGREDKREREDADAQKSMFGRICNSFFEDIGGKIKGK